MPQSKEVLAELAYLDRLIWWIDVGRYSKCKTLVIPKVKPITAEELADAI